jgi:4-amino-4-deoxy-L-arabinose transferase-like glycosyltransferase
MGGAVLSKGLIGVALPALALIVYASIERDGQLLRRLHWLPGLLVLCGIALPWFILVQHRNPEFFQFFFVREHFERYLLPDHHRPGAWWYYAPVLALGLLPWTPCIPAAARRGWSAPAQSNGFKPERFLVVWSVVIVVFFSASQSKLPGYVLPVFPALLLLLARHYPEMSEIMRRAPAYACAICGIVLLVGAALHPSVAANPSWPLSDAHYAVWLIAAAIVMFWAGIHALHLMRTRNNVSIPVLGLGSLLALQLALSGMHSVDGGYSSERFIEGVVGEKLSFPREWPFYSVATYDQSIPFYLGRPVTLVAYKGELAAGIAAEPEKYIGSLDEFVKRWLEDDQAFAVMARPLYEKLTQEGLPGRLLARDEQRAVIARR